ncbi:hypothetical protein FSP39_013564 [Pinctada imbricata]|uniref:Phospholipid/glycerol acyltransferase domain-containing protein n=1 Tax=Pinctada imbricata TaxID=66713 RepID=A0AA88XS66_PINIB|nr:hypothetical protein FSP39_013564 [Pinctada imbricata]
MSESGLFSYHLDYIWTTIDSLDIDYWRWVVWVIYPIIISFLLPLCILILFYASSIFLHVYHYRHSLQEAYTHDFWDGARKTLAALWDAQGWIWHGFEIDGIERIPSEGPALLIYYHGTLPVDFYYIVAKCLIEKNRHIRAVGDRFLFHIPGWRLLLEVMKVTPGTVQSCVSVLKDGHLLGIAPGCNIAHCGVREALFGDELYPVMWGKRLGFSKVATEANVPIIPIFTQNVREAFRTPSITRNWLRWVYEKTRLPIVPIYGFFPVKLKSFVGEPIVPGQNEDPEDLAKRVQVSMQELIKCNQRLPGSILRALVDRLDFLQIQR